ncbi:hypothetical protein GA0070617_0027, partial [Micromonospora yangpuensis]
MPVQTRRRSSASTHPSAAAKASAAIPSQRSGGGKPPGDPPKPAKKRRRKDPLWARITVVVGAVLMVTSGAALAGSKAVISQATGSIAQRNLLGEAGKSDAEGGESLEGPIDMLLLG